ncbi:sugar transferase [Acidobacteria bacterium AH-259-O06]|nr:sugar transferase [Acidobacteria bacterium AH-259-O06]
MASGRIARSSESLLQHILTWVGLRNLNLSEHIPLVIFVDVLIGVFSYLLAFLARSVIPLPFTQELMPLDRFFVVKHYWWVLVSSQVLLLFLMDAYHEIPLKRFRELVWSAFAASGLQALGLTSIYFFTANLLFPRSVLVIHWILNTSGVVFWRMVIQQTVSHKARHCLLVGSARGLEQLLVELHQRPQIGLEIVGLISDSVPEGTRICGRPVLGSRERLAEVVGRHGIQEVLLMPEGPWHDQFLDTITGLESVNARVHIVPSVYEILIGSIKHFNVQDVPLIEIVKDPDDPISAVFMRLRDLVVSMILLILFAPLGLLIAVGIRLSDGGGIFYTQERIGQGGQVFRLYKFRTMQEGAEHDSGPTLTEQGDPRLTRIGALLRRYRLDEIPQLLNVLKNEMSLVGPRPERPEFVRSFSETIRGYDGRHKIKPGITGLAQIRARYHSDPEIKLKYDLAYICNRSLLLDLVILVETVRIMLGKKGL